MPFGPLAVASAPNHDAGRKIALHGPLLAKPSERSSPPNLRARSLRRESALPNLDFVVREIADEMRRRPDRGEVATYIPELAGVDAQAFGLAVVDAEGNVAAAGDSETL